MKQRFLLVMIMVLAGLVALPAPKQFIQAQDDDNWEVVALNRETGEIILFEQNGNISVISSHNIPYGSDNFRLSPNRRYLGYVVANQHLQIFDLEEQIFLQDERRFTLDERDGYRVEMGAFSPDSTEFVVGFDVWSDPDDGEDAVIGGLEISLIRDDIFFSLKKKIFFAKDEIYADQITWDEEGIFFRASHLSYLAGDDYAYRWNPESSNIYETNRYLGYYGTLNTITTNEIALGGRDYDYPHEGEQGMSGRSFNAVVYYEDSSTIRQDDDVERQTIYFTGYGNEAFDIWTGWVDDGNGIVVNYSQHEYRYISRSGDIIDLSELTPLNMTLNDYELSLTNTHLNHYSHTFIGTTDGWLLFDNDTNNLLRFTVNDSVLEVESIGEYSNLYFLEGPMLTPAEKAIPFTPIPPHDWGEPLCEGALPSRLQVGSAGAVVKGFEIPVHTRPRPDELIFDYNSLAYEFLVEDGPKCEDGSTWWKILYRYNADNEYAGWVRESEDGVYWLEQRDFNEYGVYRAEQPIQNNLSGYTYPRNAELFCPGYLNTFSLDIGMTGQVLSGAPNNVRLEPYLESQLLGQIPGGGVFRVTDGPRCSGSVLWWYVHYNELGGWMGEGIRNIYWVEPYDEENSVPTTTTCEGFLPSRLSVGTTAKVTAGAANNVRSEARYDAELMGQIPGEAGFAILDGPVCGENSAWWQVEYEGITGWTAEGQGDAYWLEP